MKRFISVTGSLLVGVDVGSCNVQCIQNISMADKVYVHYVAANRTHLMTLATRLLEIG